jgi:hypothetical protein
MKRPEIDTVFGPVALSASGATERLVRLFTQDFRDTYLSRYYAKLRYDEEEDSFSWFDEEMNLQGPDDLLARLERDKGGRWSCDVNIGFAPSSLYPSLFLDPPGGTELTAVVTTDQGLTGFVEDEPASRIPFVVFLARIAEAIGAPWFLSALELRHWKRFARLQLLGRADWPAGTYVACWKGGTLDDDEVLGRLGASPEQVVRTTLGYHFLTFFPAAP